MAAKNIPQTYLFKSAATFADFLARAKNMLQPTLPREPAQILPAQQDSKLSVSLKLQNVALQTLALETAAAEQARFIMRQQYLITSLDHLQKVLAVMPSKSHERLSLIKARQGLLGKFQELFQLFASVPKEDYRQFLRLVEPRLKGPQHVLQVQEFLAAHGAAKLAREFSNAQLIAPTPSPTSAPATASLPASPSPTRAATHSLDAERAAPFHPRR